MIGRNDSEELTDEADYGNYYDFDVEEPYTEYSASPNQHAIKTYQQILDEPWLDDPLREMVETRLEDLLEG